MDDKGNFQQECDKICVNFNKKLISNYFKWLIIVISNNEYAIKYETLLSVY